MTPTGNFVGAYHYTDEQGTVLYDVVRYEPKDFRQRRSLVDGTYEWNLNGVRRVPYRLPKLITRIERGDTVFVVEGEKDANALGRLGFCATTNCGGASWKWTPEFVEYFRDAKRIVVIPDCDEGDPKKGTAKGREAARKRAQLLLTVCPDVRFLDLAADRHDGFDVSNWLEDGHSREELMALVDAAPRVEPIADTSSSASAEEVWPELNRQVDAERLPPPMPRELLPEPLRQWVEDICERMCVPIEMVAAPLIVALAATVGRQVGIRPGQFDDWLVVPNLWGAVIARPGLMKTPVMAAALEPLVRLADRAHKRYIDEMRYADERKERTERELEVLESQLKIALKKAIDKNQIDALHEQIAAKKSELESEPIEQRYIVQDSTTEKLGELLRDNPRGLLQSRDELAGWLSNMDKKGREGDRAFYLEGWNGTGQYTVDRIGRGTIHIPALALSVFGGITPGALESYINEATSEGRGADGLLQRHQVIVWPGSMPEWRNVDRIPDTVVRDRVYAVFEHLDTLEPQDVGAMLTDDAKIPYMRFSPEAQPLFDAWRDELERRLRSEELHDRPAFESHIAKYRSLMPTLALLFHLVGVVDGQPAEGGVSLHAARLAAAWCEYLETHAERIYAAEGPRSAGGALARHIEQRGVRDGDGVRGIYRHNWSKLDTAERVIAAAEALEPLGWIRLVENPSTGGRPGSPVIRLHPDLRGGNL